MENAKMNFGATINAYLVSPYILCFNVMNH